MSDPIDGADNDLAAIGALHSDRVYSNHIRTYAMSGVERVTRDALAPTFVVIPRDQGKLFTARRCALNNRLLGRVVIH